MYFYKAFKPSPVAEKGGVPLSGAGNFLLAQKVTKDAPKGTPLWYPRRQIASACSPVRRSVTIHAVSFSAAAPAVQSITARHQRRCASVGANFFFGTGEPPANLYPPRRGWRGAKSQTNNGISGSGAGAENNAKLLCRTGKQRSFSKSTGDV